TPQEPSPVDDGDNPDCVVFKPVQHTVAANNDFPIAECRELWYNPATLGKHRQALGGRQQPLNQSFSRARRVPRNEVVDLPEIVPGALCPSYCRHVRTCARTSSCERVVSFRSACLLSPRDLPACPVAQHEAEV